MRAASPPEPDARHRARYVRDARACGAAFALAAGLAVASPARADLSGDADRLAHFWQQRGAAVAHLPPIFLEHGQTRAVVLDAPPDAPPPAPADGDCVTVAVVGARTVEFVLDAEAGLLSPVTARLDGATAHAAHRPSDSEHAVRSQGGTALLVRCGAERSALRRVLVEMTSPRAALEVFVARSSEPLGAIAATLPERAAGPIAPRGSAGGPLEPGSVRERVARAAHRARVDGAAKIEQATARASEIGVGEFNVRLHEGCYRADLMAAVPAGVPHRSTDLDAEAHAGDPSRLLARDHAEVPDARLDFCVGETTSVAIPFSGAAGAAVVTLAMAEWPLPEAIPVHWGARARAGFATAFRKHHVPDPKSAPIVEALGVQGLTRLPVNVEPGKCYVASVALIRGDARIVRLSANMGDRVPHDDLVERPEGAVVAFCAETETTTVLEMDMRGTSLWWAAALWPMGTVAP